MTIYLDIVFIENILMNYIILFGTGLIQKIRMKNYKIIIASTMGAIYAIASYLNIIPIYSNIIMKVTLSLIMIFVAFNPQNVKKMLKSLVLFYLISFVTGGCAFALLYLISPSSVSFKNGVLVGIYPMKVTIIAGALGFLIIQYSFSINKRKLKRKDLICNIKIKVCGKLIQTKAYIDSGNHLKDPMTNNPVIIIEKSLINEFINIEEIENIKGGGENFNIRLIPFKSIGKQNGMLMGIKADYIEIEYEEDKTIINKVVLGMYDKKISKSYSALIGLNLLNGGNENEYNSDIKKNIFRHSKRRY